MNPGPADVEVALQRLRWWRDGAVAARQPGAETIRDIHLSMVARSGRRIPSAIAEVLPQSLKGFAGPMARAMAQPPGGPGHAGHPGHSGRPVAGPVVTGRVQAPGQGGPGPAPQPRHAAGPGHVASGGGARNVPLGQVRLGGDPGPATPPAGQAPPPGQAPPGGQAPPPGQAPPGGQAPRSAPSGQAPRSAPSGPAGSYPSAPPPTSSMAPGPEAPVLPGGPPAQGQSPANRAAGQAPAGIPGSAPSAAQGAAAPRHAAMPGQPPAEESEEARRERLAQEWAKFAPLDFSEPGGEPGRIQAVAASGGGIRLRWKPPEADPGYTIYRVVSGDDYAPYDPQNADFVELTTDTSCVDERRFRSAIRHLQVWRNSGATQEEAYANQPVLHAQLPVVSPVADLDLREDEGRVIGQWSTFPGVKRVQVYRIPIERAQSGFGDPAYRILADDANLGGFVDHRADRGRRYVYQFYCEAEYEGLVRLSAPATKQLLVSAVLEPVNDLTIELDDAGSGAQFDLTWSNPPAGQVVIFRTERPPRAGASAEPQPESALPQMGLPDDARLVHPIVAEGEQSAMRTVPWPRGWVRTYFTPVTRLDGRVQVGRHIPAVRTMAVTEPVVVERTQTQILKFGWPRGASYVSVFLGARDQPAEELLESAQRMDISEDEYTRLGGMHFARPLPSSGCSVHMVGVSYSNGERVESTPVSVQYPGLLRLSYTVEPRRGLLARGAPALMLRIRSEVKLTHAPPFLVVFNPDRFPLETGDGDPVDVVLDDGQANQPVRRFVPNGLDTDWSQQVWQLMPPGPGFVRLFLDLPPERLQTVALLDPDINQLIVRG